MKNIFMLLLVISSTLTAQSVQPTVEKQFLKYSRFVVDRNFDKALDYTNPEIFRVYPREQLKNVMEMMFTMPGIEFKTNIPTLSDFEAVRKINEKNYIRFKSQNIIEMKFLGDTQQREDIIGGLENEFGKENVTYDQQTHFYKINSTKTVIAVSDAKMKDWKFVIVDNPQMKSILESFIPKELLN